MPSFCPGGFGLTDNSVLLLLAALLMTLLICCDRLPSWTGLDKGQRMGIGKFRIACTCDVFYIQWNGFYSMTYSIRHSLRGILLLSLGPARQVKAPSTHLGGHS